MSEAIGTEKVGARVYVTGDTYALKDRLKAAGCHWDGDRRQWWIGAKKEADLAAVLKAKAEPQAEDPDQITLIGKAVYKGRNFYVRWLGDTKSGERKARLITLDGKVDFWADAEAVELVKRYEPRTSSYSRYRQSQPMTLGSIQRFIARQRQEESQPGYVRPPVCAECHQPGHLIEDMEDGLMKHYRCCDMPSER